MLPMISFSRNRSCLILSLWSVKTESIKIFTNLRSSVLMIQLILDHNQIIVIVRRVQPAHINTFIQRSLLLMAIIIDSLIPN